MNINFKAVRSKFLLVPVLAIALFSACKKDNGPSPEIIGGIITSADTTTVGEKLVLHPKLSLKKGLSYQWVLNGETVGTDSVYTFTPTERGNFNIKFSATNKGGTVSSDYNVHVWAKYENGFYIINEGWFGHGTGTVSFYRYNTKTYEDSVFVKTNPTKNFDPTSTNLASGTIFKNKLYIVSKVGGPLVQADAFTLKETNRIAALRANDFRAFVGIDDTHALVSSSSGIFQLSLPDLILGSKIPDVTGQVGDMVKAGNYVFALSSRDGVVILNASDYTVAKKIAGMQMAFAVTPDGSVWAAGAKNLVKINPTTLEVETIVLPFTAFGSWGAWHVGSITASTKSNTVFIGANGSFSGAKTIYRYKDGDASSLTTAFITLPAGTELYGAGIKYNPNTNQVVLATVKSGYGENYSVNNLYFHNEESGDKVSSLSYAGYYFPAVPVFH